FSLMENKTAAVNVLKAEDIRDFPQLGEDIYRAVTRLPGLSGNDYSAKFAVRGGEQDEVLVLIDGMELYEPFHLKDVGGGFSIIDVEAIKNIDMITGAFPAEYGNRMSGVFNMNTGTKTLDRPRTSAAISFMNTRFLTEGSFNQGKGYWMVLGRRGYIDYILKLMDADFSFEPVYYDLFGKVQYFLNENNSVSAQILASDDEMRYNDDDKENINGKYGNFYSWLKWDAQFRPMLFARTVLSYGNVGQDRYSDEYANNNYEYFLDFRATNNQGFDFYGLKQDWNYQFSDNYLLKWGFDTKRMFADYDYDRNFFRWWETENTPYNIVRIDSEKKGTEFGAYLSNKIRIFPSFTTELGLRYDHASWTEDENFSPRVNFVYNWRERTALRIGWGKFYQTQGIHMLDIIDNEENYYPAELSEHIVAGLEHEFDIGISARVEFYVKNLKHIRPYYFKLGDQVDMTPETSRGRIRLEPEGGESSGFEVYLRKDNGGKHSWWVNYSNSDVHETANGIIIPRNLDQTHTLNLDYNYRPNNKWSFNASWNYHTGWPYTIEKLKFTEYPDGGLYAEWSYDKLNRGRFPAYHRMDVRLNRYFYTSYGRVSTFFEVRNLYNRKNVQEYDYYVIYINSAHDNAIGRDTEHWLPMIPSFGLSIDFQRR
ncbi:TonB-dependent receptor plug domain-containing protein, partial [candidate division KSB1 bacterium]